MRIAKRSSLFIVAAVFAACGGATQSDLLNGGPADQPGSDAATDQTTDPINPIEDASVPDRNPPPIDAQPDVGADTGPDAPEKPTTFCGEENAECDTTTQDCCATDLNAPNGNTYACKAKTPATTCTGVRVGCSDTASCGAGKVCCGEFINATSQYRLVECRTSCTSPTTQIRAVRFCNPDAPDCPDGGTCGESGAMDQFHVCPP